LLSGGARPNAERSLAGSQPANGALPPGYLSAGLVPIDIRVIANTSGFRRRI